jgi:hypothetical protein
MTPLLNGMYLNSGSGHVGFFSSSDDHEMDRKWGIPSRIKIIKCLFKVKFLI